MRLVTMSKSFTYDGAQYVGGHKYVMAEESERIIAGMSGAVEKSVPIDPFYLQYKGEALDGKTLLTWRTGGNGDMLMLIPALQWLKKKYPTMRLIVATACPAPLEKHPAIDRLIRVPFDSLELGGADYHAMYEGLLEGGSKEAATQSAVDLYMRALSIDPSGVPRADKLPKIYASEPEEKWYLAETARLFKPEDVVVGIQIEASSPVRKYPEGKLIAITQILVGEGAKVVIIGGPDQSEKYKHYCEKTPPGTVIDGTKYTIRKSIVLAKRYDLIIAPDSMMVQVGAAYETPTIGQYGPFHSSTRMKYHSAGIGLDARVVCSPCCVHDFRPCVKGFPSPCFTRISVKDVLESADYLLYPKINRHFRCLVPEVLRA